MKSNVESNFHQIVAAVFLTVAGRRRCLAGHKVDFLHTIRLCGVETLQKHHRQTTAETWVQVVGEEHGFGFVAADVVHGGMGTLIRRNQTILFTVQDDGLQRLPVFHRLLCVGEFVFGQFFQVDVETQFAHRCPSVRNFTDVLVFQLVTWAHIALAGKNLETPLDVDALVWVGIIRAPELGEIFQRLIVAACAAARTEHQRQIGIILLHTAHHVGQSAHIVDIQVRLVVFRRYGE